MKKLIFVIIGIVLGVVASFFWISQREGSPTSSITGPIQYTCELSGGTFEDEMCQCPKDPEVAGAPAYNYDAQTGFCVDSFGIPGGEFGETVQKLQELQMLKNQ
ncbi:hypothetical protein HY631_00605 [Candidatus Uhrbacteria bacterium]|nr:hypothetical protein [Candidatus Uhrbacteria bacterium]